MKRIRHFLAGLCMAIAILLNACAHHPASAPPIAPPVPCTVNLPALPVFAFDTLPPGQDIFTQVKTLLADRQQRIAYEGVVVAAATSCSK